MPENDFYTVKEVARLLEFSTNTIYKYLKEGKIKATRLGGGEGRFRIPESEVKRILQLKGKDTQLAPKLEEPAEEGPAPAAREEEAVPGEEREWPELLNRIAVPRMFDWYVAILAIFMGMSLFLISVHYVTPSFYPYFEAFKFLKLGLIGGGLLLLAADIFETKGRGWKLLALLLLASLFSVTGFFYLKAGLLLSAVGRAALVFVILLSIFSKLSELTKFLFLINVHAFSTGFVFLYKPGLFAHPALAAWIADNRLPFALFWFGLAVVVLFFTIGTLRKDTRSAAALSLLVAAAAFAYASLSFSQGDWGAAVYSLVLGSFALLFSSWHKFHTFSRLSKKELVVGFLWLVSVLAVGTGLVFFLQQTSKARLLRENNERAKAAAAVLRTFVEDGKKEVVALSTNKELVAAMAAREKNLEELDALAKTFYFKSTRQRRVLIVDEEGKGLAIYPLDPEFRGIELSDREYFRGAKEERRVTLSPGLVPRLENTPQAVIVAGAPILDRQGNFLGVLAGSLGLQKLALSLNVGNSDGSYFAVADQGGQIVLNNDPGLLLKTVEEGGYLAKAVGGEGGVTEGRDEKGVLSLLSYQPVKSLGWGLAVYSPLDEITKRTTLVAFSVFLITLASGVGALMLVINLRRWQE